MRPAATSCERWYTSCALYRSQSRRSFCWKMTFVPHVARAYSSISGSVSGKLSSRTPAASALFRMRRRFKTMRELPGLRGRAPSRTRHRIERPTKYRSGRGVGGTYVLSTGAFQPPPASYGPSRRGVRYRCTIVGGGAVSGAIAGEGGCARRVRSGLEFAFAAQVPVRATQLLERLRLDLAGALARHPQLVADDVERPRPPVLDPEPQLDDRALAGRQHVERRADALAQQLPRRLLLRRRCHDVLEDAAERTLLFLADRGLERDDGLAQRARRLAHLVGRHAHELRKFGGLRLAAQALEQALAGLRILRDQLGDVNRQPDRASLVGDGAPHRLPDPPRRVRAEAEAAAVLELLDGAHEPAIAFLDQVHQRHAAAGVLLRDAHHEPEVCVDHVLFGALGLVAGMVDVRHQHAQPGGERPVRRARHALVDDAQRLVERAVRRLREDALRDRQRDQHRAHLRHLALRRL